MIIQEVCPKCGRDLLKISICTDPPIPKWVCQCGWSYEGERERIVRVPFNEDADYNKRLEMWRMNNWEYNPFREED